MNDSHSLGEGKGSGGFALKFKLLILLAIVLGAWVAFNPFQRGPNSADSAQSTNEHRESTNQFSPALLTALKPRGNEALIQMSRSNVAYQAWGRELMLKMANEFLSKVPFYGLNGTLRSEEVLVTSDLTPKGAKLWLATANKTHSMQIEYGLLFKIHALEDDFLGVMREPEKMKTWIKDNAQWTSQQAEQETLALLARLGYTTEQLGIAGPATVRAEEYLVFDDAGKAVTVKPFYEVLFVDEEGGHVLEVHYRSNGTGKWLPTFWFNNSRKILDPQSTSYATLHERFFRN